MQPSNQAPKISVLMSVYNNAPTVAEAIKSILAQTVQDFEFIIVDDASTDGSLKILQLFSAENKNIIVIQNSKNEGLAISLNRALEQSRGEFIARQDAHATSRPDRFAKQLADLAANPKVDILGIGEPFSARLLKKKNIMVHGSIMARAKMLKAAGGYNPNYRFVQDYELWLRLIPTGAVFANLAEPLYEFTQKLKSPAETRERLLYLMNAKAHNREILPLSKLPLIRKLEFHRYLARYFIKRFLGI